MRVVIGAIEEVRVVGSEHRQVQLFGQLEDPPVERRLILRVVRLDLEVIAIAEDVRVPRRDSTSLIVFFAEKMVGDLPGHARRRHDNSLVVPGEQLPIHARLGVESFRVGEG